MSHHLSSPVWLAEFPRAAMKTIALKLADCADDDGEGIYPSVARVSRETGCAESTVREVLAAFEECGLLIVVSAGTGNRFNRSTTIRRFDLIKLLSLCAVDHRNGTFTPPTHCMRQFETGETRENKKGEQVRVLVWRIVPRGPDDPSVYDKVAPPGFTPPVSGGAEGSAPPESGGVPLRRADPTPPVSGGCPSGERTLTLNEPSNELPPLPPVEDGGRERGDTTSISVDEKARPKAAEIAAELRQTCPHTEIVETLFVPMLAERKFVAPMPAFALKQRADWIAKKPAMDADGLQLALRKLLDGRRMSIEPSHIEDAVRSAENEITARRVSAVQRGERVTVRRGDPGWQPWLDRLRAAGRFAAADLAERWGHLDATSADPEGAKLLLPTPTMERLHERQQAGDAA